MDNQRLVYTSSSQSPNGVAGVANQLMPDELTLHLVASGIVALANGYGASTALALPYPPALQRGLDRLVVACLRRGLAPPQSVPDLLTWCQCPLRDWQLAVPPDAIRAEDRLLDGEIPTDVCMNWACASADVEAELSEQRLLSSVFDVCTALNSPAAYTALRQLWIEHPVMTTFDLHLRCMEPLLDPLQEQIHAAYEPAPVVHARSGEFVCCARCGNLLLRTAAGGFVCEDERCRRAGSPALGQALSVRDQVLWLKRGLRRFVAAPSRSELHLANELRQLNLVIELWPAFDRYDLRVTFPHGDVWAIDVKDWANPFLLAKRVKPIPLDPSWTRAFFVFPDDRRRQRPDYLRAFTHFCPLLSTQTKALFASELLAAARRTLKES